MASKLQQLVDEANKEWGDGTLLIPELGGVMVNEVPKVIPTGNVAIDKALGVGGVPCGRITEIMGQEACLDADTKINYIVWDGKTGKVKNHKGGTIKSLYEKFNNTSADLRRHTDVFYTVPSFNEENAIFHNRVFDVVKTGKKRVYLLETKLGNSILATKEHKFYTPDGFKPLSDIKKGDTVFIHNNTPLVEDTVVRKKMFIEKETYDIKCLAPYNNYIANGFAVHNSGKTTIVLHLIANAQKMGKRCAFIDAEHSLDRDRAEKIGVDFQKLAISQPDSGEQALELLEFLIRSGQFGLVVVDSVAALIPKAEIEGEMTDANIGSQARMMGKIMRKITAPANKGKVCVIFTNQVRAKLGGFGFIPQTTTPGGNALKFYASMRLDMVRTGNKKRGETLLYTTHKLTVKKNKLAPPAKVATFSIGLNGIINDEAKTDEV